MGTLGNVPLSSANGRCTVAALSCIKWKAHHEFHVRVFTIYKRLKHFYIFSCNNHDNFLRMVNELTAGIGEITKWIKFEQ